METTPTHIRPLAAFVVALFGSVLRDGCSVWDDDGRYIGSVRACREHWYNVRPTFYLATTNEGRWIGSCRSAGTAVHMVAAEWEPTRRMLAACPY